MDSRNSMHCKLRPLYLEDAARIRAEEIFGRFSSVRACRDYLRSLLRSAAGSDRQHFVFTAEHRIIACLTDAPAAPDLHLRLLTLYLPSDVSRIRTPEIRRAFERRLLEYLRSRSEVAGVYLLFGSFTVLTAEDSRLPIRSAGSIPLVQELGPAAPLTDLSLSIIDLRDVGEIHTAFYATETALLILEADAEAILRVRFHDPQRAIPELQTRRSAQAEGFFDAASALTEGPVSRSGMPEDAPPHLRAAVRQLDEYFAGRREVFDLPLKTEGTVFQEKVWSVLKTIPYGQTFSYLQVAEKITKTRDAARRSARAVGAACGANPISVFIPCHRVISSDGKLTGFAGGLKVKEALLNHEIWNRMED